MDAKEVKKIADLARIELSDAEIEKFKKQFTDILGHIGQMDRLDLTGIEPACHPFNLKNVFRDDKVVEPLGEKILSIAPASERGMIKVPAIIEGRS